MGAYDGSSTTSTKMLGSQMYGAPPRGPPPPMMLMMAPRGVLGRPGQFGSPNSGTNPFGGFGNGSQGVGTFPGGPASSSSTAPGKFGVLRITVLGAKDLRFSSTTSSGDPFIQLAIGVVVRQTAVAVGGGTRPRFSGELAFDIRS